MANEIANNIGNAVSSNLTGTMQDVVVASATTDGATGSEVRYTNTNWSKYLGYYRNIPECKIAVDTLARWTIGDGFIVNNPTTQVILDHISGWGCDTFDDILENMDRCCSIGGDAFAEIIKDESTGTLVNLKVLDPSTITIVADAKGIIKRYEQTSKINKSKTIFQPREILHLSCDRIADEIHGISFYEGIKEVIDANYEVFKDVKQLMHRHVKPIMAFKLDTDNETKINTFMTKMDAIINKGENIYIPKQTCEFELVSVPSSAVLSPFQWIEHLRNYFYQVCGIPQILMGGSSEFTESTAKIALLSFEQVVKKRQRYIITQIWNQLFLRIDLDPPVTIKNELLTDTAKDGQNQEMNLQPAEINPAATTE